ncbi:MAG: hypothetical protein ACRC80_19690 [Waterburya sp.]
MSIKFTKLSKVLVIAAIASLFAIDVKAEMKPLDEAFKDAYHKRGKDAFQQSNIFGQFNAMFGFTGFPEQHIAADGKAVDRLYQETLAKQTSSGEYLATQDLKSPYETSLQDMQN